MSGVLINQLCYPEEVTDQAIWPEDEEKGSVTEIDEIRTE